MLRAFIMVVDETDENISYKAAPLGVELVSLGQAILTEKKCFSIKDDLIEVDPDDLIATLDL